MFCLCVERKMKMEEVFDSVVTVPYLAQVSAKLGKDKILQVCKIYKSVIVVSVGCMYIMWVASYAVKF